MCAGSSGVEGDVRDGKFAPHTCFALHTSFCHEEHRRFHRLRALRPLSRADAAVRRKRGRAPMWIMIIIILMGTGATASGPAAQIAVTDFSSQQRCVDAEKIIDDKGKIGVA